MTKLFFYVVCISLMCSSTLGCMSKGTPGCLHGSSCCSGICTWGICTGCGDHGVPCSSNDDCCGDGSCDFGFCVGCGGKGVPCTSDANCCGSMNCNMGLCGDICPDITYECCYAENLVPVGSLGPYHQSGNIITGCYSDVTPDCHKAYPKLCPVSGLCEAFDQIHYFGCQPAHR